MNSYRFARAALLACLVVSACEEVAPDPDPDPDPQCPASLPAAPTRCDDAACSATSGNRTFTITDLSADLGSSWLVVSWVASELFENENLNVVYTQSSEGGLTPASFGRRLRPTRDDPVLYAPERLARVAAQRRIRQNGEEAQPAAYFAGTGIRGRSRPPADGPVIFQTNTCSASEPSCGTDALCVIPTGEDAGTCETELDVLWRDQFDPSGDVTLSTTVRGVGTSAAIVTEEGVTLSDDDVAELLRRFDERIAPLTHQFFGEPRSNDGNDFDRNDVVILLLTPRVADISSNLVGFFQRTDLQDPAVDPRSNGADLLYLQPPGGAITLDALSGTMAHEYVHLIVEYAKVLNRQSSQESAWLDEGLATFAEDLTGYGSDAFKNVAAYLTAVGDTALTGFGLIATDEQEADSLERRGMAHLFLRYFFERRGGAQYGDNPDDVTDRGGIAALRSLVQSPDTGLEAVSPARLGRPLDEWLADFYTMLAVDDAVIPDVSCNPTFSLADRQDDAYTGYVRGIRLRTSIPDASGATIRFNGPTTSAYSAGEIPVPVNGGEIRTLDLTGSASTLSIAGPPEDYVLGLRAIPVAP